MATLYKHGEIGQIERLIYKIAYCADGNIMQNNGNGWKLWKKLKEGIDPRVHFEKQKNAYQEKLNKFPCFASWRNKLHKLISFKDRAIVVEGIKMLGNDLDGLWSELNDYGRVQIDLDDLKELIEAYNLAIQEAQELV